MKNVVLCVCTLLNIIFINAQDINYSLFKGNEVLIDHFSRIDTPYILDYKFHSKNDIDSILYKPALMGPSENLLFKKYERDLENNSIRYIKLLYKVSYKIDNKYLSMIKYLIGTNDSQKSDVFIAKDEGSLWKELKKSNYPSLEFIINNINVDLFWQFYSKKSDSKYPEVNKLKPLVKDENGILNIEKLAKVIRENQSSLKQYLD